jgi:hypothetical protein
VKALTGPADHERHDLQWQYPIPSGLSGDFDLHGPAKAFPIMRCHMRAPPVCRYRCYGRCVTFSSEVIEWTYFSAMHLVRCWHKADITIVRDHVRFRR